MNAVMRHERGQPLPGQTLVLFALMSLLLLAGLGLIFDAGLDYSNRRTMQNAADTAALRGARVIAQKAVYADDSPPVWAYVKTEVTNAAVANGVPEADDVICHFLDDDFTPVESCHDREIPTWITGVRVRVSETHTPIVMRALGITTTGTAATAAAQVQMVKRMHGADFPFMVCGIDTAVVGGADRDILTTRLEIDPGASPSPSPLSFKVIDAPYAINDDVYSYDWNVRDLNGDFDQIPGAPQFIIGGNGIERCGLADWQGLVVRSNNAFVHLPPDEATDGDKVVFTRLTGTIDGASEAAPRRTINGPQGCKAGEFPHGCIMILPIADPDPWCPTLAICQFYRTEADREQYSTSLYLRRWGAFYVVYDGGTGQYLGRLIKNYPMHTDGITGWDPETYVGPINVTLIQASP
jgi:hypothetical protein